MRLASVFVRELGLNALANQEGPSRRDAPPPDAPPREPGAGLLLADPKANAWPASAGRSTSS